MDSIHRMNVRSLSEMVAESSGIERLRLTAKLAAALQIAGVASPIVSIYNNGMDLETLTTSAVATFNKQEPRPKFGNRPDHKEDHALPDGSQLTITITSFNRGSWRHQSWTHKTQYKLNGKVASKDAVKKAIAGDTPLSAANQALLAAFEAQAPVVAADFIVFVRHYFQSFKDKYGAVPAYPSKEHKDDEGLRKYSDSTIQIIGQTLSPVCDTIKGDGNVRSTLALNEAKLAAAAKEYGDTVCIQWFSKTLEKLGDVEAAELLADKDGFVSITGTRAGRKVFMRQQRVLKWSTLGTPFNQFPAHLYVDGKFVTEAAYTAMFKGK